MQTVPGTSTWRIVAVLDVRRFRRSAKRVSVQTVFAFLAILTCEHATSLQAQQQDDGRCVARLPNGSQVEIVAICDPLAKPMAWWKPDGTPTTPISGPLVQDFVAKALRSAAEPSTESGDSKELVSRIFVFRETSIDYRLLDSRDIVVANVPKDWLPHLHENRPEIGISPKLKPPQDPFGKALILLYLFSPDSERQWHGYGHAETESRVAFRHVNLAKFAPNIPSVTIRTNVQTTPWMTVAEMKQSQPGSTHFDAAAYSEIFSEQPKKFDDRLTLLIKFPNLANTRVVAVYQDGTEYSAGAGSWIPEDWNNPNRLQTTANFHSTVHLSEVRAFRIQARVSREIEFQNIALTPGRARQPAVLVKAVDGIRMAHRWIADTAARERQLVRVYSTGTDVTEPRAVDIFSLKTTIASILVSVGITPGKLKPGRHSAFQFSVRSESEMSLIPLHLENGI